ncbi:MAG: hypothetical protein WBO93_02135, partial [Gammaproteobacteria bacterium]
LLLRFSLQSGAYEYESCACSRDPGEKCGSGPYVDLLWITLGIKPVGCPGSIGLVEDPECVRSLPSRKKNILKQWVMYNILIFILKYTA